MDKDDDDMSDGEIDDDIDMEIATKLKSKYEMLNKDKNIKNKSKKKWFIYSEILHSNYLYRQKKDCY